MKTLLRFKAIWITGFLCTFLLMSGCVSTDMSDLDRYVQETLARPGGRIEPLPEIKPYEAYAYQSAEQDARDPFELFYEPTEEIMIKEIIGLPISDIQYYWLDNINKTIKFNLKQNKKIATRIKLALESIIITICLFLIVCYVLTK